MRQAFPEEQAQGETMNAGRACNGQPSERTQVLVVADVRLYREGLAGILAGREGLAVIGTAGNCDEALRLVALAEPNVAVLDMATRDSLKIVRAISEAAPTVKIIAFAIEELDREILACAEAGVAGYVLCEASTEELVAIIESVVRGELVCPPSTVSMLFRRLASLAKRGDEQIEPFNITGREREIAVLIDSGLSNKEIAQRLNLEVATVKNHVHNILEKLNVTTRGQAAARLRSRPARSSRSELSDRD